MLRLYRWLPQFRGKLRLGKLLFKNSIGNRDVLIFHAHNHLRYKIPNTLESLGVELLITGIYEKKTVGFLKHNIRPGDIYFDIGANIGAIGLPVVKEIPSVKYVGFEASPVVFDYLQTNFKVNQIAHYQLHNYIVHASDAEAMPFYQCEQYGKSSLAANYTQAFVLVDSISLDTFCIDHQIDRINWIKVDVQGFELFVFKGMQQLLQNKKVNNILFEFEYWAEADAGLEKGAAQDYLKAMGYSLFTMDGVALTETIREGRAMIWGKSNDRMIE